MNVVIGIFTFFLILVSIFLILLVLAQKAKSDGGMGSALGGGATEATFGADTSNVLNKATIYASVAFFLLSFVLYLGHIYNAKHGQANGAKLPTLPVPAAPAVTTPPAAGSTTTPAITTDATTPATATTPALTLPELAAPTSTDAPASATPAPAATTTEPTPAPAP